MMIPKTFFLGLCFLTAIFLEGDARPRLPKPRYERNDADPAWLQTIVQFHGHLGPSIVAGARVGMAGLRAVEAQGYFDIEIVCEGPFEKPPQSCFLDGLQVGAGTTLGKRNLIYREAKEIVVRAKNTATGKTAEIRPTPKLLEMLGMLPSGSKIEADEKPQGAEHRHSEMERIEAIARQLAAASEEELLTVEKD
jgi:formylmethanofuran dehydrogenase subunit E